MNKGFLKKFCQIEYILILLSALTFIPTEIFKNHTNESFAKLDQSFLELQSVYGDTQISAEEKDIIFLLVQNSILSKKRKKGYSSFNKYAINIIYILFL